MIKRERGYIVLSDITVVDHYDELTLEEIQQIIEEEEKEVGKADKWALYPEGDSYGYCIKAVLYRLETEKERDARVEQEEKREKENEARIKDRERREKEQELAEYKRLKEKYGNI